MPVKIKYVGPYDEVELAAAPGVTVKRRGVVEVHRDIADELVRSGEFKRVVAKNRARTADEPDNPDEVEEDDDAQEGASQEGVQPEGVEG